MTRVAVTTTRDTAPRLVWALASHGLDPVVLPCIDIEIAPEPELDALRRAADAADWLVLTSRRPIEILWPTGMPALPVAAVGHGTAEAVEAAGGEARMVGRQGAEELVPFLLPALRGKRVVFPHAAGSLPNIGEAIRAVAAHLTAGPVYAARPIAPDGDPPVEAVMFGSPSAVAGWLMSRTLDDLLIGAIGGTTATSLAEHGYPAQVVPHRPGFEALVDALARHIHDHVRRSP